MGTWEVIKFLTENPNSDKVFVSKSKQGEIIYDIYLDDYTKGFIIDKKVKNGWECQLNLSCSDLNKILWINNWE